jgi:hypothetical protein
MENKLPFFCHYIICNNANYISQQRIIPNILRKKIPLLTSANLDAAKENESRFIDDQNVDA